jgi:GTP 3',8-cyclase
MNNFHFNSHGRLNNSLKWLKYIARILKENAPRRLRYLLAVHNKNPVSVEIETDATCNRRCNYCPLSMVETRKGRMSTELYHKIIRDLKMMNFSGTLSFHFYNEPLLDERLENFIAYASKQIPDATVLIYTNGDKLTKDRVHSLVDSGTGMIRISIHDSMAKNKMTKLLLDLEPELNKKIKLEIYYEDETALMNRGGIVHLTPLQKKNDFLSGCDYVQSLVVNYEGNTALCCNDFFVTNGHGSLKDFSVTEVWKKSAKKRRDIFLGDFQSEICQKCVFG